MRLMICLTNVLCSNEDVEKQPVPIAGVAIPIANNEYSSSRNGGRGVWKTTQFCYSPIYYYLKIIISVGSCVSAVMIWVEYSNKCAEWANNDMLAKAWFFSMIVLWAIQGVVHLVFIVTRFITKQPPSDTLYSGKFEAMLRLPLMIELVILIVVAVVGLILIHAVDKESTICVGEFKRVKNHAIIYIVLGLLMIIRFGKAPQSIN